MEKDSALYQLMDTRMNGAMNSIVNSDGEYQEILRRSDVYSGKLERIGLPVDGSPPLRGNFPIAAGFRLIIVL